jgi:hypothetical protein
MFYGNERLSAAMFVEAVKDMGLGYRLTGSNRTRMARTGESEKLIGIEGDKALVTLVTSEASKLQRIASYTGMRENDVSQERSD